MPDLSCVTCSDLDRLKFASLKKYLASFTEVPVSQSDHFCLQQLWFKEIFVQLKLQAVMKYARENDGTKVLFLLL